MLLSALLITGNLNAQKNLLRAAVNLEIMSDTNAREENVAESAPRGLAPEAVNTRALKDFNRNYKNATNVHWYNAGKGTVAIFKENSKQTRVVYYPNGRWLHTLFTYGESELSDNLKSIIKNKYPKYSITAITEVHEGDKVFHFINLENDKDYKQLIAYLDEVWIHKQFKKQ